LSYDKIRYEKYHTENWSRYKKILETNGHVLQAENKVGLNEWTAKLDYYFGDGVWVHNGQQMNNDMKIVGNFGAAIKKSYVSESFKGKIDNFDFIHLFKDIVYRLPFSKLIELYKDNKFYLTKNDKVDDERDGLIRISEEVLKENSIIFQG
jgi:hypothetical protein